MLTSKRAAAYNSKEIAEEAISTFLTNDSRAFVLQVGRNYQVFTMRGRGTLYLAENGKLQKLLK